MLYEVNPAMASKSRFNMKIIDEVSDEFLINANPPLMNYQELLGKMLSKLIESVSK